MSIFEVRYLHGNWMLFALLLAASTSASPLSSGQREVPRGPPRHCRDGREGPCVEFYYGGGTFTKEHGYVKDGEDTAFEYCRSWTNNADVTNFTDIFDCSSRVYHCYENAASALECFPFSYGQPGYGPPKYATDNVSNAEDFCLKLPGNENYHAGDIFGVGQCPESSQLVKRRRKFTGSRDSTSKLLSVDPAVHDQPNKRLLRREALIEAHQDPSDSEWIPLNFDRTNESNSLGDSQQQEKQPYHCFPFGLEGKCFNVSSFSQSWAEDLCNDKVKKTDQKYLEDDMKMVFANGSCPKATYHCRDAGFNFECTNFSFGYSTFREGLVDGDSVISARAWCIGWESNRNYHNFSKVSPLYLREVFGTGPCPRPPLYHCLDKLKEQCFSFSYGEHGYTKDVFVKDDAEHAKDYCVNMVNSQTDTVTANDVFGHGPCPSHH